MNISPCYRLWLSIFSAPPLLKLTLTDFTGAPAVENLPASAGDTDSIPGGEDATKQLSLGATNKGPVLHEKRNHHGARLVNHSQRVAATEESPCAASEDPAQPINKQNPPYLVCP